MHITCAAGTDKGKVRPGNEDFHLMAMERGLFVVADGMGGHAAGEVASEMTARTVLSEMGSFRDLSDADVAARLFQSVRHANQAVYQRTLVETDKRGMGTTVTALILFPERYLIAQVGDSRAYLYRKGELSQITRDHSYVQEQVDAGLLTPEQARTHPYANVITRCVGSNEDVTPDLYFGDLEAGDLLLLASDGLTGMVTDPQLAQRLGAGIEPEALINQLIADANRQGGLDNITAIVVRVDSLD